MPSRLRIARRRGSGTAPGPLNRLGFPPFGIALVQRPLPADDSWAGIAILIYDLGSPWNFSVTMTYAGFCWLADESNRDLHTGLHGIKRGLVRISWHYRDLAPAVELP